MIIPQPFGVASGAWEAVPLNSPGRRMDNAVSLIDNQPVVLLGGGPGGTIGGQVQP